MTAKAATERFRENPPLVLVLIFLILLIVSAVILIQGNFQLANEVTIYAYYFLLAGVLGQLAWTVYKERVKKA